MSGSFLRNDDRLWQAPRMPRRAWRACIALVTGLAFILLLSTAATHHHESSLDDRDCAICTAVVGKVSGGTAVVASTQTVLLLQYAILSAAIRYAASFPILFFPPICGPPSL